MYVLRIEHPVPSFEGWKKVFDSDPVGRRTMGVRRYRIMRAGDNAAHVLIDLEFDSAGEAEALLGAMRVIWGQMEGSILTNPHARIVEIVEAVELQKGSSTSAG